MSDPDTLEDWVEENYDPEEQTPIEFVEDNEWPNAGAGAIALAAARRLHKDFRAGRTEEDEAGDILPVQYDKKAARLRNSRGRFIGWVEAAIKYIGHLGRRRRD